MRQRPILLGSRSCPAPDQSRLQELRVGRRYHPIMENILDSGKEIAINLIAAGVVALLTAVWGWNRIRVARKIWPFRGRKFTAILSTSVQTPTGQYLRPASGIGQIRALAILVPSIVRAWRRKVDVSDVMLCQDVTSEVNNDLVLLGGPKNNSVTDSFLQQLGTAHPDAPSQTDSVIDWSGAYYQAKHGKPGQGSGTRVSSATQRDYGLIIRWSNPFDRSKVVILLAGASTYGTIAASLWYVGQRDPECEQESRRLLKSKYFAALVESPVSGGHVGLPRLVQQMELS